MTRLAYWPLARDFGQLLVLRRRKALLKVRKPVQRLVLLQNLVAARQPEQWPVRRLAVLLERVSVYIRPARTLMIARSCTPGSMLR